MSRRVGAGSSPRRSHGRAFGAPCGLTPDEVEEIREAFNLFDTEGQGSIDIRELKQAMSSLGFENKNPTIFSMIVELERELSGSVDFETFLDGISGKLGDKESRSGIQKIFNLFDVDRKGTIGFKELKRVARELGEVLSDEELKEMIERADGDGDGELGFEDFYSVMVKKTFV